MNADFSDVRITTDSPEAARVGARAFARGADVHFAPGHYRPDTPDGQALLGHELAHVVQQRAGRATAAVEIDGGRWCLSSALESHAERVGRAAARGEPARLGESFSAVTPGIGDVAQGAFTVAWSNRWAITGRPEFPSATTTGLPVEAGDHRAHTASWQGIRDNVQAMLNSDGSDDHLYEVALIHVLEPLAPDPSAFDLVQAFTELQRIRDTDDHSAHAASRIERILTALNGVLQNLDAGHGSTNSTIQGHYDPKVEQVPTADGTVRFDLRSQDREAITATAHLYSGLLLDANKTVIYASTFNHPPFTRGQIPVACATGLLKEMVDGSWYTARRTKSSTPRPARNPRAGGRQRRTPPAATRLRATAGIGKKKRKPTTGRSSGRGRSAKSPFRRGRGSRAG